MQALDTLVRESAISSDDFRLAMRRLAGGVSIISAAGLDGPLGVTATAVVSLTAEPPSVLCCLNRSLALEAVVKETGRFAVNMLRAANQTAGPCLIGKNHAGSTTVAAVGLGLLVPAVSPVAWLRRRARTRGTPGKD